MGVRLRLVQRAFHEIRRLLPHQAGVEVGNRAVAVIPVSRKVSLVLCILAEEVLPLFGEEDFSAVAVASFLARIDDSVCANAPLLCNCLKSTGITSPVEPPRSISMLSI